LPVHSEQDAYGNNMAKGSNCQLNIKYLVFVYKQVTVV